jgi:hypothetical protein
LAHPVEALHEIDMLTPQPYAVASPQGQPITRPLTSKLLKVALVVLLAVPLGLFVAYKLLPSPTPTVASPAVPAEAQCAPLTVGNVPKPLCAVITLLEPLKQRGEEQDLGLLLRLKESDSIPSYVAKEPLTIQVQTPNKFDSYVYVDYYSADGTVVHLFPTPQEAGQRLGRSQALPVDRIDGQPIEIRRPFGIELVTVVASQTPLFPNPRAETEDIDAYVHALRQVLTQEEAKTTLTATFSLLTTRDNN